MAEERNELGRRRLLVLGVAVGVPACSGAVSLPFDGPFRGYGDGGSIPLGTGGDGSIPIFGTGTGTGVVQPGTGTGTGVVQPGTGTGSAPGSGTGAASGPGSGPGSGTGASSGPGSGTGQSTGPGSSTGSGTGTAPTCPGGGNTYLADFASNPDLKTIGKGVTVSPPGYSDNYGNDSIYVVQTMPNTYIAYSLSCTHAGCVVNAANSGWQCYCHGATFSSTGAHTGGPGFGALQSYTTCADAMGVTITLQ